MARAVLGLSVVLVDVIFQYRTLVGKTELGCGLDWDDIEAISQIEHQFRTTDRRRKFRREPVSMDGMVRGDRINDLVEIVELGPGGIVCTAAPFIARGEIVELTIDHGVRSYRFNARGIWLKDDGEDYRAGLAFVGMPVCLHKVQLSKHETDLVDRIATAA